MNKLELELDEKKVLADGEYNLDELYGYIDYIAVTEKGLRKGRPLLPVEQDLLGLRAQARRPAAVGTVMGLPRVRCAPRPRRQCGEKHTGGGETHPLQHGRYRGARGNRGGYSRLNARGEDVRPEGTVTVPDGRPRRTENPLVSTMGSVNLPCSVRLSLHCSCCSPSRS